MDDISPVDQFKSAGVIHADKGNIKVRVVFNCGCAMEVVESVLMPVGMMQFKEYCNTHFFAR